MQSRIKELEKIERIEVAARGDVRRAKLYYLRGRIGKRARVRERRYTGPEELVEPGLLEEPPAAPDAEGPAAEADGAGLAGDAAAVRADRLDLLERAGQDLR